MKGPSATVVILLALSALTQSCAESLKPKNELERAIARSEERHREFLYRETTSGTRAAVQFAVADNFRYRASLTVNNELVVERVVADDALAVKVSLPGKVPQLQVSAAPEDQQAYAALLQQTWVTDPAGAPLPSIMRTESVREEIGLDPIADAVNLFDYFRLAIDQAAAIQIFNPDDLNYFAADDPFPHPEDGSNITRIDLIPPGLALNAGAQLPRVSHFRKMSFYLREGLIFRVLEKIDVEGHRQLRRALRLGRNPTAVRIIESIREGRGQEEIRQRQLSVDFEFPDEVVVQMPAEGVTANLQAIFPPAGESPEERAA